MMCRGVWYSLSHALEFAFPRSSRRGRMREWMKNPNHAGRRASPFCSHSGSEQLYYLDPSRDRPRLGSIPRKSICWRKSANLQAYRLSMSTEKTGDQQHSMSPQQIFETSYEHSRLSIAATE